MRFWRFSYQNCSTTTSSTRWEPGQQEIPRRPWTQIYQLQKEKTTVQQPNPSGFNQISFFWYSNNVLGFLHELQDCRGSQQQLLRASRPQLQQPGRRWLRWRRTGKHLLASNAGPVETERNHKDGEGQLDVEANLSQIFKQGPKLNILTTLLAPMRRKEMATRMEDATR